MTKVKAPFVTMPGELKLRYPKYNNAKEITKKFPDFIGDLRVYLYYD